MAETLVKIDQVYKKFVTFKEKKRYLVIYRRVKQNIYDTLDAAMV